MPSRHSLLFTALAALLGLSMAAHAETAGPSAPDVKPLLLKPRGIDPDAPAGSLEKQTRAIATKSAAAPSAPAGSMERLKQRLEEKLGATPDPEGDRVIRVVNRSAVKAAVSKKPSGKAHEAGEMLASASMSAGHGGGEPVVGPSGASTGEGSNLVQQHASRPLAPWDYHGAGAPNKWGKLDPAYNTCATGRRQSPIDIRDGIKVELEPLKFEYKPTSFSVIDDGHTVQVNMQPGNFVSSMGRRFELVEFHFHRPAEEVVEGKRYDMVIHMLHRDAEGRMAMVAVLLDKGQAQQVVQTIWNNLPLEQGEALPAPIQIDLTQLLPGDQSYFTYMGSLTMPPCTEGVLWMVLRQPVQVSDEQIDIFSRLYPMNARPLQEASGRLIKHN